MRRATARGGRRAPNRFMVHLALNEVGDEHVAANSGEKVSDEEYAAATAD